MLESYVIGLVDKYIAPFAEVDAEEVKAGVRRGEICLSDVNLRTSAFDALEMPLSVKSGKAGELRVKMGLRNLRAAPSHIVLRNVDLVVGPAGNMASAAVRSERKREALCNVLREDEQARRVRIHGVQAMQPREQSFFYKLLGSSMDSLTVQIENLHVRYEDDTSDPSRPFSAGVTLESIELSTADIKSWLKCEWAANSTVFNKLLSISNLGVYWQEGTDKGMAPSPGADKLPAGSFWVLSPLSAKAMATFNRGTPSRECPRFGVKVSCEEIRYAVDCTTLQDVVSLLDAAVRHSNREDAVLDRPAVAYKGNAKVWWKFAIESARSDALSRLSTRRPKEVSAGIGRATRYVPLFKKALGSGDGLSSLSKEEQEELAALEASMPHYTTMALRGRVEEMLLESPPPPQKDGRSMFARLLRGWGTTEGGRSEVEVVGVPFSATEGEICELIGEEGDGAFTDIEADPLDAPQYSFSASIDCLHLIFSDRKGCTGSSSDSLASAAITGLSFCGFGCRGPELAFSGEASITSILAKDSTSPIITGGGLSAPLLNIKAVQGPPGGGGAAYSLCVHLEPSEWKYSRALAVRASRMGSVWRRVDGVALTALISRSAAAQMEQQRLAALYLAQRAIKTREAVDLTLRLDLPDLVFPGGDSLVVMRGGLLTAKSTVSGAGPPSAGAVDRCDVVWSGIGCVACGKEEDWRRLAEGGEHGFSIPEVKICMLVAADRSDMSMTQLSVEQVVPEMRMNMTSDSLRHATRVVLEGGWNEPEVGDSLDYGQVSSLVSMGMSFASTAGQGWEYMQRSEMSPIVKGAGTIRAYADWKRVVYTLHVGKSVASFSESRGGGSGEQERLMLRFVAEKMNAEATIRSLDASGSMSCGSFQVWDMVQTLGKEYERLVWTEDGKNFVEIEAKVWHKASPDHPKEQNLDIKLSSGTFNVGVNLETLAAVQNVVVDAVDAGCRAFVPPQSEPAPERWSNLMSNVETAEAVAKSHLRRRPIAFRVQCTAKSAVVSLYASRDAVAYPVARITTGDGSFLLHETRSGKVVSSGSVRGSSLTDLTVGGGNCFSFADSEAPAAEYTYEWLPKPVEKGNMQVRFGSVEATLSPRFMAELYAFVCESAVYRTNIAAAQKTASGVKHARMSIDAAALSQRHSISVSIKAGGCKATLPVGDDGGMFLFTVPPFETCNTFDGPVERMLLTVAVGVSAISGSSKESEDLASISFSLESARQLSADTGPDVPVLLATLGLGSIEVTLSQQHVSLAWQAAASAMSAMRTALASSSANRGVGEKDMSILDVEIIKKSVESTLAEHATSEMKRQAKAPRSSMQMLDLQLGASFDKLHCTFLGQDGRPLAAATVTGASCGMWVRSDTSWKIESRVFSVTLDDVEEGSSNAHRALIRPSDPYAELASFVYSESKEGDGRCDAVFSGAKVVLSAAPVFTIASQVLSAFTIITMPPEPTSKEEATKLQGWGEDAAAFWSGRGAGGGKFEGNAAIRCIEVVFLQECSMKDSPRISFAFSSGGHYSSVAGEGGKGTITVDDIELNAQSLEFPDPLNMLERTSVSIDVTASPDGRCVDIDALCRTLDFVITYQDVKLIYAIFRSCVRSSDAAGMMETAGAQQIGSLVQAAIEESKCIPHSDPLTSPLPPSEQGVTKLKMNIENVSVALINDCLGSTVPFGTFNVVDSNLGLELSADLSSSLTAKCTVELLLYNVLNSCFEPLVEPWKVETTQKVEPGGRITHTTVGADGPLDINICELHMRQLVQTLESWMQDSKTWGVDLSKEDPTQTKFWPYRLRNEAGTPFTFWLGSSLEPPSGEGADGDGSSRHAPLVKNVAIGGEEAFQFTHDRGGQLQARQREMSMQFHTLSIRFEGIPDVLTHVPVDILGVHMLPLGNLRAVAEIHSDSGAKIIAIQSIFKVYNKTSSSIETSVYKADGEAAAWTDTFAGDMHGCVPLGLVDGKFMRLRPSAGYELSSPIEVPVEPVTGKSLYVVCMPREGTEGGAMHFRVRLDAKKPIGGHEERMRVVISIHPAFRVHNCLPYAMQIGVHCAGKLIASVLPSEGAMEHLYCTDLQQPISMAAFLSHYRKGKEVMVYSPDPSATTAKTVCLTDDAGQPLHLGIETTTSAWGDLTVVFFAQYLILNFSSLPLRYGVYGGTTRNVKPCAGQIEPPLGLDSPKKSQSAGDKDREVGSASSALNGIYAVFGPRSSFSGKLVATKPAAAESELENASELQGCVAIIARGIVPFTEKARRAAAAGAVGVVFVNSDDSFFLAEGDSGPGIRLPCAMLSLSDGRRLLDEISGGDQALKVTVAPQAGATRQRASSMQLEWKRVVPCEVLVFGETATSVADAIANSPLGKSKGGGGVDSDLSFPDSWMETPGDAPFMHSYDSVDLTGNRLSLCVQNSEWSAPFSLESMGTTGVLEAPGVPSAVASLKKARPLYELGVSFQLGTGHFARSKIASVVPRYTMVNRTGHTIQLCQTELISDVHAHIELPDGDLQPFHWIDEKRARTVMLRIMPKIGTSETFQTGWGGPIKPEQVGSFALRLPSEGGGGGDPMHLCVEIKLRKAAAFIIIRKAIEDRPMYRVTNTSGKRIVVWQEGGSAVHNGLIVAPGSSHHYSWDRPNDSHVLMLGAEGGATNDLQKVRFDEFGKFKCPGNSNLLGEVLAEGSTRCLRVFDETLDKAGSEASKEDSQVITSFRWKFSGLGISVVDSKLEELLYLSITDILVSFESTRLDDDLEIKIQRIQVDNQIDSHNPVVFCPDPERGAAKEDVEERPMLHVSVVRSKLYGDMGYFKYFAVGVREMKMDLEETFVIRLLDTAQNVVDASTATPSEENVDDIRSSGFKRLKFLSKSPSLAQKVYLELFQLHPILLTLSFHGTGAIMQRASTEGGGLTYNPMFAAMKALGVIVTSIDNAPIELNALVLERPFATAHELLSSIRKHYSTQMVRQLYNLIGAFEFLGNPVGLVNNLGTGMHDFFYEPAQGITKSPQEFAKGVSKGTTSLLRNLNYGVFNAASKITGSMTKGLVQLTGDDEYIKKRRAAERKDAGGQRQGAGTEFANEVSEGFSGIFAKPMAGYAEGGASGFFKGLGNGLLGAVVKPTAGLSDLISKGAEAARDTSKTASSEPTRVRPPRVCTVDGVLRNYDSRSAHGCDALRRIRGGEWKDERYIGFCALDGDDAVVVTDQRVCVHPFGGSSESWSCELNQLADVSASGTKLMLKAPPTKGRTAERSVCARDESSCEYLMESIRKAATLREMRSAGGGGAKGSEYML